MSKVKSELSCLSYFENYGLPLSIVRPFNVYGPKQNNDTVSSFIKSALENKDIILFDGGRHTRDFIYIDDLIDALLILCYNNKSIGESFNIGTSKDISIKGLAEKIKKYTNSNSNIILEAQRQVKNVRSCCDLSKTKNTLNWHPKISIDGGLKKTIKWIKSTM